MSFHTITQLVRFALTYDAKVIDNLRNIPYSQRHENTLLKNLLQTFKNNLSRGSKIERFAVCGWVDGESEKLFSDILENLPQLRTEYEEQINIHGNMSEFSDENFDKYQDVVQEEKKEFEKIQEQNPTQGGKS